MPVSNNLYPSKPATVRAQFGNTSTTPLSQMSKSQQGQVQQLAERYKQFLWQSVCAPLAAKTMIETAQQKGFKPFPYDNPGSVKPGDKFYINNNHKSVALVVIGKDNPVQSGFNIVGAHMDSPQLLLKPNALAEDMGMARFKTQTHGGGIWGHWFNRPLGIAGRVSTVQNAGKGQPLQLAQQFVRWDNPAFTIPSEPIHFNREINQKREIKPENDLNPVAGIETGADGATASQHVTQLMGQKGINLAQAKQAELYLYPNTPPQDSGADGSLITGAGQDDKMMCFAAMDALFEASQKGAPQKTSIAFFFDDEEVGSQTNGGADSAWANSVINQVIHAQAPGSNLELGRAQAMQNTIIYSADVAHGLVPTQKQYQDPQNAAKMGYGPALKINSNARYATDARGVALTEALAAQAGVPLQTVCPNQDVPCGTTIGPIIASHTNALTIDIGAPILSMHSPGEVSSKSDLFATKKLFSTFYQSNFQLNA